MSHWEYYGEDQHRPDIKIILKDILSNTEDTRAYQRFNLILSEIERLEERVEKLEEEITSLESYSESLKESKEAIEEHFSSIREKIINLIKE